MFTFYIAILILRCRISMSLYGQHLELLQLKNKQLIIRLNMGSLLGMVLYSPDISCVVFLVKGGFNGRLVTEERKCEQCSSLDLSSPKRQREVWVVLPLRDSRLRDNAQKFFSLPVLIHTPPVV